MNFHIVRTNETLKDIGLIYNIDEDEIKEANKHIRIWDNLSPGLKIKLPEIPDSLSLELDDVEPFIEDYYPKLDILLKDKIFKKEENIIKEPPKVESKNMIKPIQYQPYYYYPPYGYNYPYRGYYNNKHKTKRK